MKYRKKPVVINAIQFTGHVAPFETIIPSGRYNDDGTFMIITLEGKSKVSMGDWVIQGVKGEFYACKPDIFEMTYDKVEEEDLMSEQTLESRVDYVVSALTEHFIQYEKLKAKVYLCTNADIQQVKQTNKLINELSDRIDALEYNQRNNLTVSMSRAEMVEVRVKDLEESNHKVLEANPIGMIEEKFGELSNRIDALEYHKQLSGMANSYNQGIQEVPTQESEVDKLTEMLSVVMTAEGNSDDGLSLPVYIRRWYEEEFHSESYSSKCSG